MMSVSPHLAPFRRLVEAIRARVTAWAARPDVGVAAVGLGLFVAALAGMGVGVWLR